MENGFRRSCASNKGQECFSEVHGFFLCGTLSVTGAMDKCDLRCHLCEVLLQRFQTCDRNCRKYLLLHVGKLLLHALPPEKGIPSRTALKFRPIDEDSFVIRFSLLLQIAHILVEQILHRFCAPSCPKA